jgi:hypothetical protein
MCQKDQGAQGLKRKEVVMQYLKVIVILAVFFTPCIRVHQQEEVQLEDVKIIIERAGEDSWELTYTKGDKKAKVAVDTYMFEAEGEVDRDKLFRSLKKWEKERLFKLKDQPRRSCRRCYKTRYTVEAKWGEKENSFEFHRHTRYHKRQEKYRRLVDHIIRSIERYLLEDHEEEGKDVRIIITRDGKEICNVIYKQGDEKAKAVVVTARRAKAGRIDKDKLFSALKRWNKQGLFALRDSRRPRCWTPRPILYTVEASWGRKENFFKFWVQGKYPFTNHPGLVANILKFIERHIEEDKEKD